MRSDFPFLTSKVLKSLKILILLTGAMASLSSFAQKTIYTTHPQVAYTITFILKELQNSDIQAAPVFKTTTNIHDFEPTPRHMKTLMKSSPLIIGPVEHQKWIFEAKESGLLPKKHKLLTFKEVGSEHFWLESKRGCEFEKQIISLLKEWSFLKPDLQTTHFCDWLTLRKKNIEGLLKEKGITKVILTHSALYYLLREMNLEVLTLRGSDHDQEIPANTYKKAYGWIQNQTEKVLLIHEVGFNLPPQLVHKKLAVLRNWSPVKARPEPLMDLENGLKSLLGEVK